MASPTFHGILVVDKPAGWTSHDVVAKLRRIFSERRIGHAGTLDPFATGVLVVGVGKATRLLKFVQEQPKRYLAHIVLGAETDTCDVEGTAVRISETSQCPSRAEIEQVIALFIGEIEQVPPVYSAIKVDGKRLYKQARAGHVVEVPARTVLIHSIHVKKYSPPDLIVEIQCGTGTYVRALARDIGRKLGSGGYCHQLRRTSIGWFDEQSSSTLEEIEDRSGRQDAWTSIAFHPDNAAVHLPMIQVNDVDVGSWFNGQQIGVDCSAEHIGSPLRVYSPEGNFLGIGEMRADNAIQPAIVLALDNEVG